MLRTSLLLVIVAGSLAHANPNDMTTADEPMPPPPQYKANGVLVEEHLGARVPLDAAFRTQDGKPVRLGEILQGELPTILTFNYSDCPMLCSQQLNALSSALPAIGEPGKLPDGKAGTVAFRLGGQFRIVTIDLEPEEPLPKLAKMRNLYIGKLPEAAQAGARAGWTFLAAATPGDDASIRRVAEAVGFKYTYIPERAEWAHPAALIFLSSNGVVTRYVYGLDFQPEMMRESIYKAGLAEPATAVGFMNRCYHYDPNENSHARAGVLALRIGAAAFVVLMISIYGLMHFLRKSRGHGEIRS
jgi:protein SCO1/2